MQELVTEFRRNNVFRAVCIGTAFCLLLLIFYFTQSFLERQKVMVLSSEKAQLSTDKINLIEEKAKLTVGLQTIQSSYSALKNEDQYKINQQLQSDLKKTHDDYTASIKTYEQIKTLQAQKQDTSTFEELFASVIQNLSNLNYATAETQLSNLNSQIKKKNDALATAAAAKSGGGGTAPASNTPPGSGYSYQSVHTDSGDFIVSLVAGDLSNTRVIVDTASDGDCGNNCPVLPLSTYVSRNGAFAGINGTYFCPAAYPSCVGKTNSFDLLVMNKNKKYFNSDNNVYSNNPAFIMGSGFVRVVGHASEWGRDTSVDAVISNYPLLVSGNTVVYSDNPDPKFNSKGPRSFIAHKGNTVYIGFVLNATMGDSAKVLKALGMDDAMNLDEGGSTALWSGGYKLGPGRDLPNALLFVRR